MDSDVTNMDSDAESFSGWNNMAPTVICWNNMEDDLSYHGFVPPSFLYVPAGIAVSSNEYREWSNVKIVCYKRVSDQRWANGTILIGRTYWPTGIILIGHVETIPLGYYAST